MYRIQNGCIRVKGRLLHTNVHAYRIVILYTFCGGIHRRLISPRVAMGRLGSHTKQREGYEFNRIVNDFRAGRNI